MKTPKTKTQTVCKVKLDTSQGTPGKALLDFLGTPEEELAKRTVNAQAVERLSAEMEPEEIEAQVEGELRLRAVGELIAQARKLQGVSHRDLAQRVGVRHPRVVQVEQGENLEVATLYSYAEALGYTLEIAFVPKTKGPKLVAKN